MTHLLHDMLLCENEQEVEGPTPFQTSQKVLSEQCAKRGVSGDMPIEGNMQIFEQECVRKQATFLTQYWCFAYHCGAGTDCAFPSHEQHVDQSTGCWHALCRIPLDR